MQRHRIPLVSVLCLITLYASAQAMLSPQIVSDIDQVPQRPQEPDKKPDANKGAAKVIEIVYSERGILRKNFEPEVLKDSVILYHDGAYLYCDSAYLNKRLNTFEAFGKVRMEQGDTLFLYGKYMYYDGMTKLVKVRKDVILEHVPLDKKNPVTLFTDSLNYDRMMNVGYYFDSGMLVDTLNELTSYWGQYEPNLKMATFKDSVILTNPNFVLYSDLLIYDTDRRIAIITTPTTIVSDSGTIYTSNGWYNTVNEESLLMDQSLVVNKKGDQFLRGDSIFYYKPQGYMEVFGNMYLQDTTKKVILTGHYGYYNQLTDYAYATDSASCIEYSQGDSLYIHADTLKLITIIDSTRLKMAALKREAPLIAINPLPEDSIPEDISDSIQLDNQIGQLVNDSLNIPNNIIPPLQPQDTIPDKYRQIKAYYNVRFYRSDMQGICDSLQFDSRDSVLHMYKDPILWNTNRQLYGDTIDIFMNDSTIDYMHVKRSAFSIEEKDSIHFNQLKSRSLKVFFENKKAKLVFAEGDVETIAYPEEKGGELNGVMNYLISSYLKIYLNDGQFDRLVVWSKSTGRATPFHLLAPDQMRLKGFYWYNYLRPLDKHDIFRKVEVKLEDTKPKRSSTIFNRREF